jgi:nicotinamide-nucleotide amidase
MYFLGGVVTYSNDSKENLLKVQKSTMVRNGAVSEETAREMAAGARALFGTDISISITGVAGPGGGTDAKPVGLVWIGISTKEGTFARQFNFDGDRGSVRAAAVGCALELLKEVAA